MQKQLFLGIAGIVAAIAAILIGVRESSSPANQPEPVAIDYHDYLEQRPAATWLKLRGVYVDYRDAVAFNRNNSKNPPSPINRDYYVPLYDGEQTRCMVVMRCTRALGVDNCVSAITTRPSEPDKAANWMRDNRDSLRQLTTIDGMIRHSELDNSALRDSLLGQLPQLDPAFAVIVQDAQPGGIPSTWYFAAGTLLLVISIGLVAMPKTVAAAAAAQFGALAGAVRRFTQKLPKSERGDEPARPVAPDTRKIEPRVEVQDVGTSTPRDSARQVDASRSTGKQDLPTRKLPPRSTAEPAPWEKTKSQNPRSRRDEDWG